MEHWGKGEAFAGSARILPAAAGMLPANFARIAINLPKAHCSSFLEKLSGRMPEKAGYKPALPSPFKP